MKIDLKSTIVYSENFSKSRNKIRAYLRDMYPNEEVRTINIVLNVYEAGIAKDLVVEKKIVQARYVQYVKRLRHDYGMDIESAVEALNIWVDTCIGKGKGTRYGNMLIEENRERTEIITHVANKSGDMCVGEADIIYEDENVKVVFYKWKRNKYSNSGWIKEVTFLIENKTDKVLGVRFQDVTIRGFVVQAKTLPYCIKGNQKGMNDFKMVYENKLPSGMEKENQMDFVIYYDEPIPGTTTLRENSKEGHSSNVISICLP